MIHHIGGNSIQEVWLRLLSLLVHSSDHQPAPRGQATRELLGVTLRVNDLRNNIIGHPVRKVNLRFMIADWLWIALGSSDLATIAQYNEQLRRFSDDGTTLAGAYGPRLAPQWTYILETLRGETVSRQAVASIWTPSPKLSKDIPCTLTLQFIARADRLNVIVTMRSSDAWLGIPYDVFTFSQLANGLAGALKLTPGFIQLQLGSSHLYENDVVKAREVIIAPRGAGLRSPQLPGQPPSPLLDNLKNPFTASFFDLEPWRTYTRILAVDKLSRGSVPGLLKELDELSV